MIASLVVSMDGMDTQKGKTLNMKFKFAPFYILVLVLIVFPPIQVKADTIVVPKFGLNFTKYANYSGLGNNQSEIGFQLGCDFRLGSPTLFLQPGISWKKYGTRVEIMDPFQDKVLNVENSFHSFQFPVLVGTTAVESKDISLILIGGMVLDIVTDTGSDQIIIEDDLNNGTWAARFGFGLDIMKFTLGFSYDFGISRFFKSHLESDRKINSIEINVGIKI